ncbi:hypothetical protein LF817_07640 [Halobacillus sp. A1]|uniref:hypothetical protein n=1 Tax=Halobacillus sp. A1 TaxID=2880262 RepID=UPI0020A6A43A|nr:hypothetical protein [Halobacillus sp. A1]MCP3031218.1 hypothetical protein [Halobacillus sp. A1]
MIGSHKWNVSSGTLAFILTFLLSTTANPWDTSLFRGGIYFIIFFLIAYAFRLIGYFIVKKPKKQNIGKNEINRADQVKQQVKKDSIKETTEKVRTLLNEQE